MKEKMRMPQQCSISSRHRHPMARGSCNRLHRHHRYWRIGHLTTSGGQICCTAMPQRHVVASSGKALGDFSEHITCNLQPLINRIREIGQNYSKTPTQVVLNWLIAQENVVPIPGAKNSEQAKEFAGALGWRLTKEEIDELRSMAAETKPVVGFPVEKL
ncbi:hypothetical protein RJ639_022765 [Escallonia herrerae]|uniref:NADP-dependent oxidoreductase domain-containing protein n=1 Tax=Escallonia herrerae TaxID=1293975 RepID=A0AA88V068_9ASTE|nr:hypothetical protein RJ639_022765 [Escallonia herrerae]